MHDQPKLEPLEASTFFGDGMASRLPPAGTVARGQLREDALYFTGLGPGGTPSAELPMPADRTVLRRGQERFDVFCSPCHGRAGDGAGMVARRGFKTPPSFHDQRLRDAPVGYYFDVMTRGFGVMPSYATAVPPADRWAIAAYVRALQLSQRAHLAELPAGDQQALRAVPMTAPGVPEPGVPAPAAPALAPGESAPAAPGEGGVPDPVVPGAVPPGPSGTPATPAATPTPPPAMPAH
jgi:mono/diheme cytochrome c family protein